MPGHVHSVFKHLMQGLLILDPSQLFLPEGDLSSLPLLGDDFLVFKCIQEFTVQDKEKETQEKVS